MTEQELVALRKLQAILFSIKQGGTPFFNIAQFESLGLVKRIKKKTHVRSGWTGEFLTVTKFRLTDKGNRIATAII